ncbi:MAG: hypothetical protein ACLU4J_17710 [Butyricimonas paravirosa]
MRAFSCSLLCPRGDLFYDDPFKVLREYKKYDNDPIFLNEDYIGWKTYKNYRDSLHFDSFILGNSCTMAFLTSDWEKYLNGSKAIRLYGTAERLAAVHRKVMTLDKEEEHIANVCSSSMPPYCENISYPRATCTYFPRKSAG